MKRVLPIIILVTIVEIIVAIWLGIWVFDRGELSELAAFLYVSFTSIFTLSIPFRFFALGDMYHSHEDVGKRFEERETVNFWPFTFIWTMGPIFNKIDSFDLTPVMNKLKQFWGY